MKASEKLITAMKKFEGCKLTAYKCPAGVWTIGYGRTKGVTKGMTITEEIAERLLREDLATYEQYVGKILPNATQPQFDALVDFAFNLGTGNLGNSTLLKQIRNKASEEAIRYQFGRWNKANGKVLQGLVTRRAWEADRYFEKA